MRKIPFAILPAFLALGISPSALGQTHPSAQQTLTKINPKDGLMYVRIPQGKYQMGCSSHDSKCSDYEKPVHSVTITIDLWIAQAPLTEQGHKKGMRPT